jgi:tetratricopeptide (TPR) repeat protein
MLFDLQSGKRRRVVQVVYTLLAASFLIGFVIFGIGSGSGLGGIGDLFGGGSSSSSGASIYQSQIDQAEKQLKQDPKDQKALVNLARYRYLAGVREATTDSTGTQLTPSDDTLTQWNLALDSWEKYLKTDPRKPDPQLTQQMVEAYRSVGDAAGAAKTQQIVVDEQPSSLAYAQLSFFLYAAGKLDDAKAAQERAVSMAKGKQKAQLSKALDKIASQAKSLQKASQQSSSGSGNQLSDPFGGLGAGGTAVPPASP